MQVFQKNSKGEKPLPVSVNFGDVTDTVTKGANETKMSKQAFVRESVRVGAPLLIQAFQDLQARAKRRPSLVRE